MANEVQTFNIDALDEDIRKRLTALNSKIEQHKKRDTEGAFELGECFDEVAEVVGNDKDCETWLEGQFGYTDRHTRNYRSLRNLKRFKARCINAAILPTALFKMAHADQKDVEAVLAEFEAGRKLRVEDVTRILKGNDAESDGVAERPVEDIPGMKGFEKYAFHEVKNRSERLKELMLHILTSVIDAYEPKLRGRALVKKVLRENVRLQAEEAYEILKATIGIFQRDKRRQNVMGLLNLGTPTNDGGWSKLLPTLWSLRYFEEVPSVGAPEFLKDEAIPQLQWALAMSDAQIQDLFEQAAEKNNSKPVVKKEKPARAAAKETVSPPSSSNDTCKDQSGDAPVARHDFKLPDFMTRGAVKVATSTADKEDAA
ncbi:hypothetical protein DYI23_03855 [Roseibium polysiphoniae]|uniref:DUF3102 domain-containing protein n=1 Tax=Roseibium polysiphoniae TaxID=2571221 RepID=A0A944C9Z6_9HYPH|nr:hypothetical protein [Roseibium polysiphoniae]MBS8259348.1 hypothetical protein [Roseibium polysiphoniae]